MTVLHAKIEGTNQTALRGICVLPEWVARDSTQRRKGGVELNHYALKVHRLLLD